MRGFRSIPSMEHPFTATRAIMNRGSAMAQAARTRATSCFLGAGTLAFMGALLLPTPALATRYAGEFLRIGVGARALGMGSAFVGLADDGTSAYWNPAGLATLRSREATAMHAEQFGSIV